MISIIVLDIDECEANPCLNEGTCTTPEVAEYMCTCTDAWTGDTCAG